MKSSYRFLKVPLCLFSDSYSQLSVEAKILYAFLLDRLTLSEKNGFLDEDGSVFVYYTNGEVCRTLCCGSQKATRLFRELEKYKLINRRNQDPTSWNAENHHQSILNIFILKIVISINLSHTVW